MFFKNHLITVAARFLWVGLIAGLVYIVIKFISKLSGKNVYVHNLITFCFWLAVGLVFSRACIVLYQCKFCWFGLLSLLVGMFLVKISIEFFFTKFMRLLYNVLKKKEKRDKRNGKLQANQEV